MFSVGINLGTKHFPIKVEDFPEHVALMRSDNSIRFEREYETISVDLPFSHHAAKLYANVPKNRYKNIIPRKLACIMLIHTYSMSSFIQMTILVWY